MRELRHPNVLLMIGVATDRVSNTGILTELMQGSLLDILGEEELASQVTWGACLLAIATDVAKGMAYLHYNDFLHRDLKPGNVLLSEHWVAKVADFGATFQLSGGTSNALHGTPPYMAPEVILHRAYERPVDAWAYGCVLAHMGTGQVPFSQLGELSKDISAEDVMNQVVQGRVTPIDLLVPSETCPPPILELARQCVAVDPASRPAFETIAAVLTDANLVATIRPSGSRPRPAAPLRRKAGGGVTKGAKSTFRQSFHRKAKMHDALGTPRGGPSEGSPSSPRSPAEPAKETATFI